MQQTFKSYPDKLNCNPKDSLLINKLLLILEFIGQRTGESGTIWLHIQLLNLAIVYNHGKPL